MGSSSPDGRPQSLEDTDMPYSPFIFLRITEGANSLYQRPKGLKAILLAAKNSEMQCEEQDQSIKPPSSSRSRLDDPQAPVSVILEEDDYTDSSNSISIRTKGKQSSSSSYQTSTQTKTPQNGSDQIWSFGASGRCDFTICDRHVPRKGFGVRFREDVGWLIGKCGRLSRGRGEGGSGRHWRYYDSEDGSEKGGVMKGAYLRVRDAGGGRESEFVKIEAGTEVCFGLHKLSFNEIT